MTTNYAQHFNPRRTPQSEQADGRQAENNAGGWSFTVDRWKRLERFVVLGSEGSYYAGERTLTRENALAVLECLNEDGPRAVKVIADISDAGRAPKNDPAVFALALAASHSSPTARAAALAALPRVCRIGTHLFQFVEAVDKFRGWGRGLQRGVGAWYLSRTPEQLAFQVAKYGQRGGWSHRDVLRLVHPAQTAELAPLFRYIVAGLAGGGERAVVSKKTGRVREYPDVGKLPPFLEAFEELKHADESRTIQLIGEHGFTHEMIDSRHKNSAAVWEALLPKMPLHALVRNLAKMTAVGLLAPMSAAIPTVTEKLANEDAIRKARLHPVALLSALKVYGQGHGEKGSLTWSPVPQVIDALNGGFYKAFDAIEPSGKRVLLALDVSDSMTWPSSVIPGLNITAREASACMAMVTARSEKNWHVVGFSGGLVDIPITPSQRLDDVVQTIRRMQANYTDCALPMLWASRGNVGVDVFQVYTDNETNGSSMHPHQALKAYRDKSGIRDAKLAVIACVSNSFTIADPSDPNMLDFCGFDSAAPAVLAQFAKGAI
jgi:60 kDa SS-A/Ro ribonucleoprotein